MGEEDPMVSVGDGELMRQHIAGSGLAVIPKAGHYTPWDQPEAIRKLVRQFVDAALWST